MLPNIIDTLLIDLDNLQLGADFTEEMTFTGFHNISHMTMSFRVECSPGFCGPGCITTPLNNPQVATCQADGTLTCTDNRFDPSPLVACSDYLYNLDITTNCSTCVQTNYDLATNCIYHAWAQTSILPMVVHHVCWTSTTYRQTAPSAYPTEIPLPTALSAYPTEIPLPTAPSAYQAGTLPRTVLVAYPTETQSLTAPSVYNQTGSLIQTAVCVLYQEGTQQHSVKHAWPLTLTVTQIALNA